MKERRIKYHYHTNSNWRKCLEEVNKAKTGISSHMVYLRAKLNSRQQAYGFLYRMKQAGIITGESGLWRPVFVD